ncbi:type V CRISPR-associated protein Cas4 [Candidatus Gracilibacteria bacterium]|nr:MAG: type V CRISPR-associated protein Cas4 [Candidatus Gracilibacteria bacterium]
MESYIKLTNLNDFIYCPKSIYYHTLYDNYNSKLYHTKAQIEGTLIHQSIDNKTYSSKKNILQGLEVYNDFYKIMGLIDIFDTKTGELIERKTQIYKDENGKEKIYRGQRYQLWGQMFCLEEMGYEVKSLWIYSVKDNKKYRIYKPSQKEILEFEQILEKYRKFDLLQKHWRQNLNKCKECIYNELCDYYIGDKTEQLQLFNNK